MQLEALKQWIGRTETQADHVTLSAVERASGVARAWDAQQDRT